METTIRAASASDAHALSSLHSTNLPNDPAALLGTTFLSKRLYPRLLSDAEVALVAEDASSQVVGFIICGKPVRLSGILELRDLLTILRKVEARRAAFNVINLLARYPSGLPACELQWIAVAASARGHRLGTQLILDALQALHLKGISNIWVKTLEDTPGNIHFYESVGFTVTSRAAGRVFLQRSTSLDDNQGWNHHE